MAFHGFDFIVDAFEFAVGYREVIPGEDAIVVFQKSVGDSHQGFDARVLGLFNPVIQHQSRVVLVVLPPYTAQRFLKLVSIPYFFSIYNTKCQLLLLCLTYAFIGRALFLGNFYLNLE